MPNDNEIREMCQRILRRMMWKRRLGYHLKKSMDYCDSCKSQNICIRPYTNERIMMKVANGERCYDYQPIWDKIWGYQPRHRP